MIGAMIWRVVTSRMAGPMATAAAVLLAVLLMAALAGRAAEAARSARLTRDRDDWRAAAGRWQAAAEGWRASFRAGERIREEESASARAATEAAAAACAARVAAARRSAAAIETIVTKEVPRDANGCPDRRLVPAERLRDALVPAAR